jgi:hypothetical protein
MWSFMVFLLAKYYSDDHIGKDERGRECSTNSITEKFIKGFSGTNGSKETV